MRNYIGVIILALSGVYATAGNSWSISDRSKRTEAILVGDIKSCKQASPDDLAECLSKEAKQNNEQQIERHHEPEAYKAPPNEPI